MRSVKALAKGKIPIPPKLGSIELPAKYDTGIQTPETSDLLESLKAVIAEVKRTPGSQFILGIEDPGDREAIRRELLLQLSGLWIHITAQIADGPWHMVLSNGSVIALFDHVLENVKTKLEA